MLYMTLLKIMVVQSGEEIAKWLWAKYCVRTYYCVLSGVIEEEEDETEDYSKFIHFRNHLCKKYCT